jgi:hypothetical protein
MDVCIHTYYIAINTWALLLVCLRYNPVHIFVWLAMLYGSSLLPSWDIERWSQKRCRMNDAAGKVHLRLHLTRITPSGLFDSGEFLDRIKGYCEDSTLTEFWILRVLGPNESLLRGLYSHRTLNWVLGPNESLLRGLYSHRTLNFKSSWTELKPIARILLSQDSDTCSCGLYHTLRTADVELKL